MTTITSAHNTTIKLLRALADKKQRRDHGLFLAEGEAMLARARACDWRPVHYVATAPVADWDGVRPLLVTDKVMATISAQNNPHSIAASFAPRFAEQVTPQGLWLVVEELRDPGNMGTMLRTADAVGACGMVLVDDCCDPFGPESVRASTGSIFAMPLVRMPRGEFIALSKAWPGDVVGTAMTAGQDYRQRYHLPCLLLMGSENHGLSPALAAACTKLVHIPMRAQVESLNVATAAALLMYEVTRPATT